MVVGFLNPLISSLEKGSRTRVAKRPWRGRDYYARSKPRRQQDAEAGQALGRACPYQKSEAESERQHGAEARSIPGWLATDRFSGVAGFLNRWAAPVLWEALDEKVTPLLVENAVESLKLRGAKLELKAAGQVGWLFLSVLRTVYRKTLTQDAEIRKLRDEVAALQERQLLMKETIESAVNQGDQMEARCTALAVRVAKQKSRQKPKMPSTVQVRALIHKQKSRQKPKIPSTVQVRALIRK
ncbi:hypothetical protein NDU88_005254 [Pleurodeles waltl]|uniref:Uncharacterized protein n=1 Tax=Pleurodeles waltl TaxID=8319 RepID=A0AAV7MZY9_PLEWA|nr:hypothetical protein NDU88_005254 [Pleurodeles waltl]